MNLPALYVLSNDYREAAERLADLDLPPDVVADTLESMAGDIQVKATNVAMFARNLESMADQIKAAEAQMADRRKAIERRADGIREYLMGCMERAGITKIECPYFKIAIRDNPASVVIDDEHVIPSQFMRQPPAPPAVPDKRAILEEHKAGRAVDGTHIVRTQRLDIK
jgi:hypothetical protein